MNVSKWNSSTSFSANYASYTGSTSIAAVNVAATFAGVWLRIKDEGATGSSNLVFEWSLEGDYWLPFFSVSRTNFMASGPNGYGVLAYANGDGPTIDVLSLVES